MEYPTQNGQLASSFVTRTQDNTSNPGMLRKYYQKGMQFITGRTHKANNDGPKIDSSTSKKANKHFLFENI